MKPENHKTLEAVKITLLFLFWRCDSLLISVHVLDES